MHTEVESITTRASYVGAIGLISARKSLSEEGCTTFLLVLR